ncbi:zinc ribbon domain-containing protein [Anaerophilus nitritogenes]|uniref:zinc ribbon domain-containing protein n=1 Tax=Anaerophilus nitritogenes TaxID=2498136 RepID=UPI00101D5874|nr:zinc ribbon domain-containing protein [Anaerophilus nitritogenes]
MMITVFIIAVIFIYFFMKHEHACVCDGSLNNCCNICGYTLKQEYNYCPNCKEKLKRKCKGCGRMIDINWRKCPYCEQYRS